MEQERDANMYISMIKWRKSLILLTISRSVIKVVCNANPALNIVIMIRIYVHIYIHIYILELTIR